MAYNPNKELKLYYSIGEVAKMFNVNESLLRFWEKEFPFITPKKAGGNVRQETGYGNLIQVDHGFGYVTWYAHLSKYKVRPGQKVVRGEVIGEVGNTGKSTGPHLHYEVHVKGKVQNPVNYYFMDLSAEDYDKMVQIAANHGKVFD